MARKTPLEVVFLGRRKIAEIYGRDDERNKIADMTMGGTVDGISDFTLDGKQMKVRISKVKINRGHTIKYTLTVVK